MGMMNREAEARVALPAASQLCPDVLCAPQAYFVLNPLGCKEALCVGKPPAGVVNEQGREGST